PVCSASSDSSNRCSPRGVIRYTLRARPPRVVRRRARKAADSPPIDPVIGIGGEGGDDDPSAAGSASTAPAAWSRASAGYSEPKETLEKAPRACVRRFLSS